MKAGLYNSKNELIYDWNKLINLELIEISKNCDENYLLKCNFDLKFYHKFIIDNSISLIGADAFENTKIKNVYISSNVKKIDEFAFDKSDIATIEVSPENQWFSSENGILYNKDKDILIRYPANKEDEEFVIPSTVKTIGNSAFYENLNLKKIKINGYIDEIQKYAFAYSKIKEINFNNFINNISCYAFEGCENLEKILIKKNIKSIDRDIFYNCDNVKIFYPGTEDEFKQINGWENIFEKNHLSLKNIIFHKTLEELINEGKNLREANTILKEQEGHSI